LETLVTSNFADNPHKGRFSPYRIAAATAAVLLLALLTTLGGCGCGFDCNSDDDKGPASLTLGFSDESLDALKQVVIEVDSISFRRSGVADVVVDSFTIDALGLEDAASFQINLLDYIGRNRLLVIEDLELEAATYSSVLVTLLDGDVNLSYVQESDDDLQPLNQQGTGLSLPGFTLSSGAEDYTIEFSLAQSLRYQTASEDYLLTTEGIRVEDTDAAASLSGRIDTSLFDTVSPCDAKADPLAGNRVYLYGDIGLSDAQLVDVYTDGSSNTPPGIAQAPFAVATLFEEAATATWQYVFGYLPAGAYTLAFSCDAAEDDPVDFDGISVPLPADQTYEIELEAGESAICDLAASASC
jgi:hypothetical protein